MEKLPLSNSAHDQSVKDGLQQASPKTNPVSPKKLLLSKWTAVTPQNKEKHFLVSAVVKPEIEGAPISEIELEAALTGRIQRMEWRELKNASKWKRGWV